MTWNQITENNKKTSELIAECRALFPVHVYDEENVDKNFPILPTSTRTFKPNIEADEEHKNKSYNEIIKAGIQGITLRERLIMELQYFKETGKHLDVDNVTLTTPLYSDGSVASVYWSVGGLYVGWCGRDGAGGVLRVREAVVPLTLDPSALNPSPVVTEIEYLGKRWIPKL